jgi:phospholipid/cholesterol/gamma-HCH transport system substrate-binding protein
MSRLAKIGLFVIVVAAVGSYYIVRSWNGFSSGNTYRVEVIMDDASGLTVDSEIFMAGVPVGTIQAIQLREGRARLVLAVSEDVDLYADATVVKEASSLLGTSIIELDPGGAGGAQLEGGDRIRNVSVQGEFGQTLETAESAGEEITALVQELRRQHLEILESSLRAIDRIANRIDRRSAQDLEEVSRIIAEVSATVERISLLVDRRDEDIDRSIASMQRSIHNVEEVTAQVKSGEGNIGRAVYDDELYDRVVGVAEETEALVRQIRGLGVQVGFESAYLTERQAAQSEFSLRLLPESEKGYYQVGVVDTPGGVTEEETVVEEVTSGGSTTTTTTERRVTSDEIRFNALIARHFGPVTLRGGLIESTGGFGLDFRLVDQVVLSGEMFDFGGEGPNLRAGGTVYPFYHPDRNRPWYWLYLSGGVADILDTEGITPYFGGGLRFTDEDVRGLVGLIPLGN